MDTIFNKELDKYLEHENRCTCEADEEDYCTCYRDNTIDDFFRDINIKNEIVQVITGYVAYWREISDRGLVAYVTVDGKNAYPVLGDKVPEDALIIEAHGKFDGNNAFRAKSVRTLMTKKLVAKKFPGIFQE